VNARPCDIAKHLLDTYQEQVSNNQIKRILKSQGYCPHKPLKRLPTGSSPLREGQFKAIEELTCLFNKMDNNPIISMDTKKKEVLGELTRNCPILSKKGQVPFVHDHDYSYLATGKAIPHGIYDVKVNKGYMSIGNSHETADFVVDNLRWWWTGYGIHLYPDAGQILLLCDAGGANGYRHHRFKMLLLKLAREIGVEIIVAHYPPYCSRFNPIERCLFCHVHRSIQHNLLINLQQVADLMKNTHTRTGLTVVVRIVDKQYLLKQPSFKALVDKSRILMHNEIHQLTYFIKI